MTPFLPGDSLLFACGALAAAGALRPEALFVLLTAAAILGRQHVNFSIGKTVRAAAFTGKVRFLKPGASSAHHEFFERHGGKAIFLARFVPIIRTFAPFVAGIGTMSYTRFLGYTASAGAVALGRRVSSGRVRVRQHPGGEEQLLARDDRDRGRVDPPPPVEYLRQRSRE